MLNNSLLLVCLAIGCGALLGRISIRQVSLGVAGVLFAGVLWGYVEPSIKPPDVLATFGLALFVYAIGLSTSEFLFQNWAQGGWRYLLIPPVAVGSAFGVIILASRVLDIPVSTAAGIFAGALTNTPSLAAATTALGQSGAEATLGYAVAYPLGVLIPILMLSWPFRREKHSTGDTLSSEAIRVSNVNEPGESIAGLLERHSLEVRFARCVRDNEQFALSGYSVIKNGDIVTLVGLSDDLHKATEALGFKHDGDIQNDRSQLDFRRIFVSNPELFGKTLRQVGIFHNYEGIVTRIKRGDTDFIPKAETIIMPGDRLRVIAPRENLSSISLFVM